MHCQVLLAGIQAAFSQAMGKLTKKKTHNHTETPETLKFKHEERKKNKQNPSESKQQMGTDVRKM